MHDTAHELRVTVRLGSPAAVRATHFRSLLADVNVAAYCLFPGAPCLVCPSVVNTGLLPSFVLLSSTRGSFLRLSFCRQHGAPCLVCPSVVNTGLLPSFVLLSSTRRSFLRLSFSPCLFCRHNTSTRGFLRLLSLASLACQVV